MADLAFRAATSGGDSSFSTNTISATLPTGEVQDDLDVILFGASSIAPTAAPTHTTPTGYSLAGTFTFSSAGGVLNSRISLFYRIAPASPAAVTLTASINSALGYARLAYNNPNLTAPFGQATFNSWTGTTPTASSMTTTRDNALLLMFVTQGSAQSASPPSGMTERVDDSSIGFSGFDVIQAVIGASGDKQATVPASSDGAWAFAEFWSEIAAVAADTNTPTDSAVSQTERVVTASDTNTPSDSAVSQTERIVVASDTNTPTDSAVASVDSGIVAVAEDTNSPTDSAVAQVSAVASASDTNTPSDSAVAQMSIVAVAADTNTPTDSAVAAIGSQTFTAVAEDTNTPSDSAVCERPSSNSTIGYGGWGLAPWGIKKKKKEEVQEFVNNRREVESLVRSLYEKAEETPPATILEPVEERVVGAPVARAVVEFQRAVRAVESRESLQRKADDLKRVLKKEQVKRRNNAFMLMD